MQPESGQPGIRSVQCLWEATNILLEFTLSQGRKGAFTKHLLRARIREAPSGSENGGGGAVKGTLCYLKDLPQGHFLLTHFYSLHRNPELL